MNLLILLSACIFGWFAQHNVIDQNQAYQEDKRPGIQFADPGDGFFAHTQCEYMGDEFILYVVDGHGKGRRLIQRSVDCTRGDHAKAARSRTFDGLPYLGDIADTTYQSLQLPLMRPVKALVCKGQPKND